MKTSSSLLSHSPRQQSHSTKAQISWKSRWDRTSRGRYGGGRWFKWNKIERWAFSIKAFNFRMIELLFRGFPHRWTAGNWLPGSVRVCVWVLFFWTIIFRFVTGTRVQVLSSVDRQCISFNKFHSKQKTHSSFFYKFDLTEASLKRKRLIKNFHSFTE